MKDNKIWSENGNRIENFGGYFIVKIKGMNNKIKVFKNKDLTFAWMDSNLEKFIEAVFSTIEKDKLFVKEIISASKEYKLF